MNVGIHRNQVRMTAAHWWHESQTSDRTLAISLSMTLPSCRIFCCHERTFSSGVGPYSQRFTDLYMVLLFVCLALGGLSLNMAQAVTIRQLSAFDFGVVISTK